MSESTSTEPNWDALNFHQVMVLICDTYALTHPQMMTLRSRITHVYDQQKPSKRAASVKSMAVLVWRRLANGTLDEVLAIKPGKLCKLARKIDDEALS